MGYYTDTSRKVQDSKKKWFSRLIGSVAEYKKPLQSRNHENWRLAVVKLLEMEVHLDGFFQAAEQLKKIDSELYYEVMKEELID